VSARPPSADRKRASEHARTGPQFADGFLQPVQCGDPSTESGCRYSLYMSGWEELNSKPAAGSPGDFAIEEIASSINKQLATLMRAFFGSAQTARWNELKRRGATDKLTSVTTSISHDSDAYWINTRHPSMIRSATLPLDPIMTVSLAPDTDAATIALPVFALPAPHLPDRPQVPHRAAKERLRLSRRIRVRLAPMGASVHRPVHPAPSSGASPHEAAHLDADCFSP
jgi:hypothetical protein